MIISALWGCDDLYSIRFAAGLSKTYSGVLNKTISKASASSSSMKIGGTRISRVLESQGCTRSNEKPALTRVASAFGNQIPGKSD